jgi:hypothetical protein
MQGTPFRGGSGKVPTKKCRHLRHGAQCSDQIRVDDGIFSPKVNDVKPVVGTIFAWYLQNVRRVEHLSYR